MATSTAMPEAAFRQALPFPMINEWETASRFLATADAALENFDRCCLTPALECVGSDASRDDLSAIERRYVRLSEFRYQAVDELIACPAPTLREFALKVKLMIDGDRWEDIGFDDLIASLKADLDRLGVR